MFARFNISAYVEDRENGEYVDSVALGLVEIIFKQDKNVNNCIQCGPITIVKTQVGKDLDAELVSSNLKPKYRAIYDGMINEYDY